MKKDPQQSTDSEILDLQPSGRGYRQEHKEESVIRMALALLKGYWRVEDSRVISPNY